MLIIINTLTLYRSMNMNQIPLALSFNCGYARIAVYEISGVQRGKSKCCINRKVRVKKFRSLFSTQTSFERHDEFWNDSKSYNFNKYSDFVLNCFSKKWKSQTSRAQYLETFSVSKWEAFSTNKKVLHSLSKCSQCAVEHLEVQLLFPCVPHFEPESLVKLALLSTCSASKAGTVTRRVIAELNVSYESTFNHTFTESVLKHCGRTEGITRKPNATEKKRAKRETQ